MPGNKLSRFVSFSVALTASFVLAGCNLPKSTGIKLGVPFRAQERHDWDYCGPAAVQMWMFYDGRTTASQSNIYSFLGGSGRGIHPDNLAAAVRYYTWTTDAMKDWEDGPNVEEARRLFFARQITAIDNREPVMPITEGGYHTGILNGGKWSDSTDGSYRIWDFVYFHDPERGGNILFGAEDWTNEVCPAESTCIQIISASLANAAGQNYDNYGDTVYARGGEGPGGVPIPY